MRWPSSSHTGVSAPGNGGNLPRSQWLSSGLWKSLPREAAKVELERLVGVLDILGRRVAAGDHLDRLAAVRLEFEEQRVLLVGRELVAARVRDHGHALGGGDPVHRVLQRGPAVRHVAGLAFGEELAKHLGGVAAVALLDQEAREVRARDEFGVADELQRAFVGAVDADLGQPLGHFLRALAAAAARVVQALRHRGVVGVEAQADDVHGFVREGHRDLGAGEIAHAVGAGRGGGAVLAADFVVVGEGPELDPVGGRARGQRFGRQCAVGDHGVAVKIGIENGGHPAILWGLEYRCGRVDAMQCATK
jgi:hypothetical protein